MPTYDYRCPRCGKFEYTQNITEPVLTSCPTCGQPVKRLISRNVGIVFKGSGWYITDSRKPEPAAQAEGGEGKAETAKEAGTSKAEQAAS